MNLRKIIFVAAAVIACTSFSANAKARSLGVHPNGIGLRFWSGSIYGSEINYQMGMGRANRFEIGLGWHNNEYEGYYYYPPENRNVPAWTRDNGFGAFGAYQWHWNISRTAARGGFNWYAGPGAGVGFWSRSVGRYYGNTVWDGRNGNGFNIDVGGQIGIEYDFNVLRAPILVSIDTRPVIRLLDNGYVNVINLGLGVRYTF